MNEEIKSTINVLPPFKRFCMTIGELPASYLETMSYYETLLWFTKYLRETVIPTINNNALAVSELQELFTKLQDYVNTYFENLDIQEEINNKLDEMTEDGSLENIINRVLNATNGSLVCSIDYRDCTEFINNITDESNPIKGYIQGFTTTPTTYIIARQTGGNYENKTNMIYLEEISKSTKETLRSAYLELFHANSLAYNDTLKEIYVATNSYIDENYEAQIKNDIIVINYNDFTIKETITPPSEITSSNRVRSVSYDNKNNVLALADVTDIWIMSDFETVENHITLNTNYTAPYINPINNNITNQNTVVYDNKIYSTRLSANGLSVYDFNGNLIRNYYDFDIDIAFQMGELESIAIENNGNIYFASTQLASSDNNSCKLYDITIIKSNLKYNGYKNYFYSSTLSNRISYYVDCDTTNKIQCGSQNLPFKSLQQAIFATQYNLKNVSCNIILTGNNKQYGFIVCKNNITLKIFGNNNKVYALQIQNQKIEIENLIVNNDALVNINSEENPCNIKITNQSDVIFNNVKILNNSGTKLTYGIIIWFSSLKMYSSELKNFTNAFRLFNFSTLYISTITFTSCDYYWYNELNCSIYYGDSNAIIERQNPSSNILNYTPKYQRIPYTFENNILSFQNSSYDSNRLFCLGVRLTYNNLIVVNNVFIRYGVNNIINFNYFNNNELYFISGALNHTSQGSWELTNVKVIKESLEGTISDITSSCTINFRDVMVI